MRFLITGGTGLIGKALCQRWRSAGHELVVLSRQPHAVPTLCSGAIGVARLDELPAGVLFDAVINLAGAPIADQRWSASRRRVLWQSRVELTNQLVAWIGAQPQKPQVLISGSAVGWYGDRGDELLDEASGSSGSDFGSRLCMAWEQAALTAKTHGVRVVLLRTAPVFSPSGGLLDRLLPLFKLGLGARLGTGRQWMPWIHLEDQIRLIDDLVNHWRHDGAVNACAPGLVRNDEFTQTLAHIVHRPVWMTIPPWVLRVALGESSVLLLGGQRCAPRHAQEHGFQFSFATVDVALADVAVR